MWSHMLHFMENPMTAYCIGFFARDGSGPRSNDCIGIDGQLSVMIYAGQEVGERARCRRIMAVTDLHIRLLGADTLRLYNKENGIMSC